MTDDRPNINDPHLSPILDAVDQYAFGTYITEEMRRLILRAYQEGRAKVIRDMAEEYRKDNSVPVESVLGHTRKIRQHINALEYIETHKEENPDLSPAQVAALMDKVRDALLKQAKRNR